jgi:hypothetical protein
MNYPELEINLVRRDTASYAVQLRFRAPDQQAEQRAEAYPVRFDFNRLQDAVLDAAAYGRLLGEALFAGPEVRSWHRPWPRPPTSIGPLADYSAAVTTVAGGLVRGLEEVYHALPQEVPVGRNAGRVRKSGMNRSGM